MEQDAISSAREWVYYPARLPFWALLRQTPYTEACHQCQHTLQPDEKFCPTCGWPQRADQKAVVYYTYRQEHKADYIKAMKHKARKAQSALFFISVLQLLALLSLSTLNVMQGAVGNSLIFTLSLNALLYAGLGVLAWFQLLPALSLGLVWMVLYTALELALDATSSIGLLFKLVLIIMLLAGVKSAWNVSRFKRNPHMLPSINT